MGDDLIKRIKWMKREERKNKDLDKSASEIGMKRLSGECQHYELKNEGNEGYGRCVKCGEEVRIY